MKKLFIYLCLPLLFAANQTFAQTQQSVVNEILAKTEYKNVYGFLNALADNSDELLYSSFFENEEIQLQEYLDKGTIKFAPIDWSLDCPLTHGDDFNIATRKGDTLYSCYDSISFRSICNDSGDIGQTFILDNQSLRRGGTYYIIGTVHTFDYVLSDKNKTEILSLQILFYREDTSIMFCGNKIYIEYNNAHAYLKEELIDNDLQGRMLVTNLSKTDSAFYSINGGNNWQELPPYVLFDKATDITIKNYYKGCSDSVRFVKDSATEMPRIHDTIKVEVVKDTIIHDTIYINKTDTIYLQTSVTEKNAINLSIYPNPTASFVNVNAENTFSYVLTNNSGKLLKKEEDAASYLLDLSEYPSGIYLLTTSDGATHKIVKE
ncbi:MAG: T9SS type A sorting domain-containing protein [Salinivirgaceae bacterium]|nr:T9SS type A sorting domain-containing protein [Salinivirgaceae bacterium]